MPTDPTALATPRRRTASRSSASRFAWDRLPYTFRYGIPLLLVCGVVWLAWQTFREGRAFLQAVDADGNPLAVAATLEFFEHDPRPSAPSPTRSLGTRELDPSGDLSVGADLIGDGALVRIQAPDHGVAYGFVEPGETCDLYIGAPVSVPGVVVDGTGAGVASARVQVFGGGPRGVLLAEVVTGVDGSFRVDGLSDTVRDLAFRVFAHGYAIGQLDWLSEPDTTVRVELVPTRPASGRLVVDAAAAEAPGLGDREVRVYQLPGITARTAADGSFLVPFLPPAPTHAYILVPELPGGWTYRRTAITAGESADVRIVRARTLRGRVVNGHSDLGLVGAVVHHEHGGEGIESVVCGADGRFEIGRVPPGPVELFAHLLVDRLTIPADARKEKSRTQRVLVQGSVQVLVVPDREPGEIVITVW